MKINENQRRLIFSVCFLLSVAIIYSPTVRCISGKCTPVGDFDFLWGRAHGERPDFLFVAMLWTGVLVVGGLLYFLFGQNDERKNNKNRVQTYRGSEDGPIQPQDQSKSVEGLLVARVPRGNHREIKIPTDVYEKSDIRLAVLFMLGIVVAVPIILFTVNVSKHTESSGKLWSAPGAAEEAVGLVNSEVLDDGNVNVNADQQQESAGSGSNTSSATMDGDILVGAHSPDDSSVVDRVATPLGEIKIVANRQEIESQWVFLGERLLIKESVSGINKIIRAQVKPDGSVNVFLLGYEGASGRIGVITAIKINPDRNTYVLAQDVGAWSEEHLSGVDVGPRGEIYGDFHVWSGRNKARVIIDDGIISQRWAPGVVGDYERRACAIAYEILAPVAPGNRCPMIAGEFYSYSMHREIRLPMNAIDDAYFFKKKEYTEILRRACDGGALLDEKKFYLEVCVVE